MSYILSDIATVKGGHPFRGMIVEDKEGNAKAVQLKDINEFEVIEWKQVICTSLSGRKSPDWLTEGDILFAARGLNNIAVCVDRVERPTVCSPHFFLIRVKRESEVLPEFLAWQLNQFPAQKYISQSSEGSAQLSVRRPVLEATPITVPSIKEQEIIVAFNRSALNEKKKLVRLIKNRNKQMQYIAHKLLS